MGFRWRTDGCPGLYDDHKLPYYFSGPFFNSFFILISNDSSVNSPDQVTCYSQANNTEPRENNRLTFTCSEPIKGRYLIIQQNEEKEVYICDFVVTNGKS